MQVKKRMKKEIASNSMATRTNFLIFATHPDIDELSKAVRERERERDREFRTL